MWVLGRQVGGCESGIMNCLQQKSPIVYDLIFTWSVPLEDVTAVAAACGAAAFLDGMSRRASALNSFMT